MRCCCVARLRRQRVNRYTLGGLYLARYDDSPAGAFDEVRKPLHLSLCLLTRASLQLVALAGLVWNPPTSCAWAARVYVNRESARKHGVKV